MSVTLAFIEVLKQENSLPWMCNANLEVKTNAKTTLDVTYDGSAPKQNHENAFDLFFTNTNSVGCPTGSCVLLQDDCATKLERGHPVFLEGGELMTRANVERGYDVEQCLACSNKEENLQTTTHKFNVKQTDRCEVQQNKLTGMGWTSKKLKWFEKTAVNDGWFSIELTEHKNFFTTSDPNCPITSCEIKKGENCDESLGANPNYRTIPTDTGFEVQYKAVEAGEQTNICMVCSGHVNKDLFVKLSNVGSNSKCIETKCKCETTFSEKADNLIPKDETVTYSETPTVKASAFDAFFINAEPDVGTGCAVNSCALYETDCTTSNDNGFVYIDGDDKLQILRNQKRGYELSLCIVCKGDQQDIS